MITRALVRPPSASFADGLTEATLGPPDLAVAREQHAGYVRALEEAGVRVSVLEPCDPYPDSTFVEDVAVLTERGAILTRPGALSRRGEVDSIRQALAARMTILGTIEAPGTVDGGDVCEAGSRVLIGLSDRTNREGASQLASLLALAGKRATILDLGRVPGLLHLKTGMSFLGEGRVLAWEALERHEDIRGFDVLCVPAAEAYAANALRVNDRLLVAAGFPQTEAALVRAGLTVVPVAMSEFRKMDGGLSCLSLRW